MEIDQKSQNVNSVKKDSEKSISKKNDSISSSQSVNQ